MLSRERQNAILELMSVQETVRISELTARFDVTVATIRRDLDELEAQQLVKRVYGGATLAEQKPFTRPMFRNRASQHHLAKVEIGKAAAALVQSGDTVLIDIGTTTLEVARQLKSLTGVTVLTNSLPVLNELADSSLEVYSLGGRLRHQELALSGGMAVGSLGGFFFDKAFIGAGGATLENGVTVYSPDSALLSSAIVARAKEVILCADSSKFGSNGFAFVCSLEKVGTIITDSGLSEEYRNGIAERGIRLIIVSAGA